MKRRFLKRSITRGTIQSLRLLKRQHGRHDRAWMISLGKGIDQTKYKYAPYLIKIADLEIGPEAIQKIKELKQILNISAIIEKRKGNHIVQTVSKIGGLEGWFNYDICDTEEKAKAVCEKLGSKQIMCRYVYVKE